MPQKMSPTLESWTSWSTIWRSVHICLAVTTTTLRHATPKQRPTNSSNSCYSYLFRSHAINLTSPNDFSTRSSWVVVTVTMVTCIICSDFKSNKSSFWKIIPFGLDDTKPYFVVWVINISSYLVINIASYLDLNAWHSAVSFIFYIICSWYEQCANAASLLYLK